MELTNREASFIKYLQAKMIKENRDYVNTNYYYVQNIARYKNVQGARYLIKSLVKKKLLAVREGTNYKGRKYIRVEFARPRVLKKLIEEYEFQKSTKREETPPQKERIRRNDQEALPINNNIIINQINHSEEKRKTTIVQDMIQAYNEAVKGTVTVSRELAPMLVAAFKQKFKTIERWKEYLRHKVYGKIKDTFRFLVKILAFSIINAAMGEMGMAEEAFPKYTSEAAFNHVDTLREAPACLDVRRKLIERKGAGVYFSWFTKAKLKEEDGHIVACGNNTFITEHLNTQFRLEFEKYYDEWLSKREHFVGSDEIITKQEEIDMEAFGLVVGHIGSCEIKEGNHGKVMKLSVSHTESSKKEDGTWDTKTTWYQVFYRGDKKIEYLGDLKKGDLVIVRGDLRTLEGKRQDGTPYTAHCIMAEKVKRLSKAKQSMGDRLADMPF